MKRNRILAGAAAVILTTAGLTACSDSADSAGENGPVRIGTTDASQKEWDVFSDLAEEKGIDIEIVSFSDYNTPNDALAQGEIDVNKFQHLKFLSTYNAGSNNDLQAISSTEIYPLALFWDGHDSLDGIEGQDIAIPNDASNQGRAINVLVQAGLLTLHDGADALDPTPADIDPDASKVTVTPVDAAQTTSVFHQGTPAIINNSYLERAGIDPLDAIFQDDPANEQAEPYINVWVTTPENADDERINQLAELWKDQAVTDAVLESSGGTAIKVDRTKEELTAIQERLEADGQ